MNLAQLNPHVRYAAVHSNFKDRPFDRICYDCRLLFFREGTGSIAVNEARYPFHAGTAFFFPPGTRYRFHPDKDCRSCSFAVFNFDLVHTETAAEESFYPGRAVTCYMPPELSGVLSKNLPGLESMLSRIAEEFLIAKPLYRETASALLKLALLELLRGYDRDAYSQKTDAVLEYIRTHYDDPELSNKTVAAAFNYHPYYLSELVKRSTGKTLHQYITSHRLRMAKQFLVTTDMSITNVAWKAGYQSSAYFIKVFKREFGVTPDTYRKNFTPILF